MAWIVLPDGRAKLDMSIFVSELEQTLHQGADERTRARIAFILRRWEFDEILDDSSRAKARMLRRTFCDWATTSQWRFGVSGLQARPGRRA